METNADTCVLYTVNKHHYLHCAVHRSAAATVSVSDGFLGVCAWSCVYGKCLLDSDKVEQRQLASQQAMLHTGQRGMKSHTHTHTQSRVMSV